MACAKTSKKRFPLGLFLCPNVATKDTEISLVQTVLSFQYGDKKNDEQLEM